MGQLDVSVADPAVRALVESISAPVADTAQLSDHLDRLEAFRKLLAGGRLPTYVPLLPLLLNLKGKPYTLEQHFPFEPLFQSTLTRELLLKAGRQVAKSASLAARCLLLANAIPHFSVLFVTPLFEQVQRFSTQYVKPFIDQSPVRQMWSGTDTENNVLRRSFKNGSKLYFSFAFLDADRLRGIPASSCGVDESVCGQTSYVVTEKGTKKIVDVQPGESILSYDHSGRCCWDVVTHKACHGRRRTWKVVTSDGKELVLTAESWLATNQGWMRVGELVDHLAGDMEASGPGDDPGRRSSGAHSESSEASRRSWSNTTGIRLSEVHRVSFARSHAVQDQEERRLRELEPYLQHPRQSSLRLYVAPATTWQHLPGFPTGGEGHEEPGVLLCHPHDASDERGEGGVASLQEVTIVSISYAGERDVWDLTTAFNHTFFANGIATSNCQDFDSAFLPILKETMSGPNPWRLFFSAGTPKTLDNTIQGLWSNSSQAEWCIPCLVCKKLNVPAIGYDLEKMIGPDHPDVGPRRAGVICARCSRPLDPTLGRWLHKIEAKRWKFPGYHVPQIVLPFHYGDRERWRELLAKQRGYGNTTTAKFYNEVLGESYDVGTKLVNQTDLERACQLPWSNAPHAPLEVLGRLRTYDLIILSVDWGGGGEEQVSFTTLAVMCWRADGKIDVVWGKRLLTPNDHVREAQEVMSIYQQFGCQLLSHDYTGAGALRETLLIQAGLSTERIVPISYVGAARQNVMVYREPTEFHPRAYYQVDKARSLVLTCACIKLGMLRFFRYDHDGADDPGLVNDFLALVENKVSTRAGSDLYTVVRNPMLTDDFAQAVNIGCCTIWYRTDSWPNLAQVANLQVTIEQLAALSPEDPWSDEQLAGPMRFRV